jgi:hypothetical protein
MARQSAKRAPASPPSAKATCSRAACRDGCDERGQPFREDAARAAGIAAEEAADRKDERDRDAADGEIGEPSLVVTVDAARAALAEGTGGGFADRRGGER